jgi:hypothetical protein
LLVRGGRLKEAILYHSATPDLWIRIHPEMDLKEIGGES